MRSIIVLTAALAGAGPAVAMGGFGCSVDDRSLKLVVESGLGGAGGALFNFRARLEVLAPSAPQAFCRLSLDGSDVMQSWLDDKTLKLKLYREPQDVGSLQIIVETQKATEGVYGGTYALTIDDAHGDPAAPPGTIEASGPISCFVE